MKQKLHVMSHQGIVEERTEIQFTNNYKMVLDEGYEIVITVVVVGEPQPNNSLQPTAKSAAAELE